MPKSSDIAEIQANDNKLSSVTGSMAKHCPYDRLSLWQTTVAYASVKNSSREHQKDHQRPAF